jgi:hypothetical protein
MARAAGPGTKSASTCRATSTLTVLLPRQPRRCSLSVFRLVGSDAMRGAVERRFGVRMVVLRPDAQAWAYIDEGLPMLGSARNRLSDWL